MKLWQKSYTLDQVVEAFTVGLDYQLDVQLVRCDCMGSIAHARALAAAQILSKAECEQLETGLRSIAERSAQGDFVIARSDEDCHTAIENDLTNRLGEVGKKIHTGRSRSDQVLTALALYQKARLLGLRDGVQALIDQLLGFAERYQNLPMPGRTHLQIAMPSSVGLWASCLAAQLLDDLGLLGAVWQVVDQNPLGAAASYGAPLDLDRDLSARELGFARVNLNVLAAMHSRGKTEAAILDACDQIGLTISRFVQDLILFSLPEFGYFSLPDELCTGSSIMPQKKNPDGLELVRSRGALVSGWALQVKQIIRNQNTGYNRDLQDTKEPLLRGLATTADIVAIIKLTFEKLVVNEDRLRKACSPELYATDEALKLVMAGLSFRDAYRQVGEHLDQLSRWDPDQALTRRTALGNTGNLQLAAYRARLAEVVVAYQRDEAVFSRAIENTLGKGIALVD